MVSTRKRLLWLGGQGLLMVGLFCWAHYGISPEVEVFGFPARDVAILALAVGFLVGVLWGLGSGKEKE